MAKAARQPKKACAPRLPASVPFVRHASVHIAVLIVVCLGVYALALANGFVSDDLVQITKNPLIRDWQRIPAIFTQSVWAFRGATRDNYYRPLQFFAYLVVYQAFGLQPWAYHLLMLVIHAAATVMIYLLARRCLAGWQGALLAGILFAVHPIHSEAVLWISSVPDALMTPLMLGAIYVFVASRAHPGLRATLAIALLYFAALLTKETGAMLLPLLLGCELLFFRRSFHQLLANGRFYAVLAAVSCAYLVLRCHALGGLAPAQGTYNHHLTGQQSFFTGILVAGNYLLMLLAPVGLNYWHATEAIGEPTLAWLVAFLACAAVSVVIAGVGSQKGDIGVEAESSRLAPKARFFLFLTAVPILPALNFNGIHGPLLAERYLYLPSAGVVLLAGALGSFAVTWCSAAQRKFAWIAVMTVLAAATTQVWLRVPVWRNEMTLAKRTLEESPDSADMHGYLARLLAERGEDAASINQYRVAVRLSPTAERHTNLGAALLAGKHYADAIAELRAALAEDPKLAAAHANLGQALEGTGQVQAAAAEYTEALRLQPKDAQTLTSLGNIESAAQHLDQAIGLYRRAIEADDTYAAAHIGLGFALVRRQQFSEAVVELRHGLDLQPEHPQACEIHHSLGVAYRGLNQVEPAIREFQAALRIRREFEPARQQLLEIQRILSNTSSPAPTPRPAAR